MVSASGSSTSSAARSRAAATPGAAAGPRSRSRANSTRRSRRRSCVAPQLGVGDVLDALPDAGSVGLLVATAGRGSGRRARPSRGDSQLGVWTPLVIDVIGTSSTGSAGQMPFHICRDTSPCSCCTPLAMFDSSRASTVMPNGSSSSCRVLRPRARNSSQVMPIAVASRRRSSCSISCGGEVVVAGRDGRVGGEARCRPSPPPGRVGEVEAVAPPSARGCAPGRERRVALVHVADGRRLARARSARMPPMPRTISCRMRMSRSPP